MQQYFAAGKQILSINSQNQHCCTQKGNNPRKIEQAKTTKYIYQSN